jgi:predicted acyltransferase (DUF342 family)
VLSVFRPEVADLTQICTVKSPVRQRNEAMVGRLSPVREKLTSCGHIEMALCGAPETEMVKKSSDLLTPFR